MQPPSPHPRCGRLWRRRRAKPQPPQHQAPMTYTGLKPSTPHRLAGKTYHTKDANNSRLPIHVVYLPMAPAGVNDMSGLNICNCSTNMDESKRMCLVWSSMMSTAPRSMPRNGPHCSKQRRPPRLAGVLTATNVKRLEKHAKFKANINVCANLLLPMLSMPWNAGPMDAANTAGQHQAPIMAGTDNAAMQLEPNTEMASSFVKHLPVWLSEEKSSASASSSPQLPPCQPLKIEGVNGPRLTRLSATPKAW
mmetsp:Transcript_70489/g.204434  ORF Transcript_70489/g.204434 Transcript_70489/m.204434 type:complete len:250 (-) Transcript_70489:134-883(-)